MPLSVVKEKLYCVSALAYPGRRLPNTVMKPATNMRRYYMMLSVIFPIREIYQQIYRNASVRGTVFEKYIYLTPASRAMRSIQPLRLVTGFARRLRTQSSKSAGSACRRANSRASTSLCTCGSCGAW